MFERQSGAGRIQRTGVADSRQELWCSVYRRNREVAQTRLDEHSKDADNAKNEKNTRRVDINQPALIDHATTENHITDWEGTKIIDKKPTRRTRQIKEPI